MGEGVREFYPEPHWEGTSNFARNVGREKYREGGELEMSDGKAEQRAVAHEPSYVYSIHSG